MDAVGQLESRGAELARAGRITAPKGRSTLRLECGGAVVHAVTQPAFYDETDGAGSLWNADCLLVLSSTVATGPALVLAVAEGNYKDEASYLSTMAAVCEVHEELSRPLLAGADVGPGLRRAFLAADERIRAIAEAPLGRRHLSAPSRRRTSLKGIGASLTVAVAAAGFVWTAHAGENRALLVRGGIARNLVVPHTLAYDRAYRTAPPEQREPWLEDIVTNVLGFGEVKLDLTRVPLEPEDRIVLGNPALSLIEDSTDLVCERDPGVLVPAYQAQARRDRPHLPATMVIADLHCAFSEG